MEFWLGLTSGAIAFLATWLFTSIFDAALKDNISRIVKTFISEMPRINNDEAKYTGYVKIGNYQTSLYLIDGDGECQYDHSSIEAFYYDGSPDSPSDIADRIIAQEKLMEKARDEGNRDIFDGIGVGIRKFSVFRTEDENFIGINIHFYKSRYAAFRASVVAIGEENRSSKTSIYRKYLENREPTDVVDFLARHVGVAAVVVTSDDIVIAAYRAKDTGVRKNEFDVSVVEGIEPTKDGDFSGSKARIDVFKTVQRGCREELGFSPSFSQIKILGFGVDMNFYQYNFLSYVKSDLTFKQISDIKSGKAKDRWETTIKPIRFSVTDVIEFVNKNRMWGFASVLFYWALLQEHSHAAVEAQAAQRMASKPDYRLRDSRIDML